jgi:hypothetical protein
MNGRHEGHIVSQNPKGNFCLTCQEQIVDAIEMVGSAQGEPIPGIVGTAGGSDRTAERATWARKLAAKEKAPDSAHAKATPDESDPTSH